MGNYRGNNKKMKDCECQDWKDNMIFINAAIDLARLHNMADSMGLPKEYKYWEYCPWCGKKGE